MSGPIQPSPHTERATVAHGLPLRADQASFELSFSPNVELISVVRQFVQTFYERILKDEDFTSRLGVAAHELLENAVKFSCDGVTHIRVDVQQDAQGYVVTITTRNRADPQHLETLKQLMDELVSAQDPLAYYQLLMRRSAKRLTGSGLGLGRIRAEAEMQLAYSIEGNVVHLQATGR
jgi:hypothetical protein